MRALLFTQHFWPEENAPALRWTWLVEALAAEGITLDVVTSSWQRDDKHQAWSSGVAVHRVKNVVPGMGIVRRSINEAIISAKCVLTALRLPRPDAIIVSAPPIGSMPLSHLLSMIMRRPLVLDLRDAWPELLDDWRTWADYGDGGHPRGLKALAMRLIVGHSRRMMRWTQRHSKLIITTSERLAEHLRQRGHEHVICIRNVPTVCDRTAGPANDGSLKVLYLGNVGRAQYLATAIRAAKLVQDRGGKMTLRIVGAGAHHRALERMADHLGAPVEFIGRVAREDTAPHYAWADSLLVMLRDWDALSMTVPSKLYDALAVGLHISASANGETAEIVDDNAAGHVVPPNDAEALADLWMRLIEQPELLRGAQRSSWLEENTDKTTLGRGFATALRQVVGRTTADVA